MKKTLALLLVALMAMTMALPMSAKANETVEALYFDKAPTFDGVITEEEWGEPTVEVKAGQATTYQHGADKVTLTMKLWLRWDEEYMYIGATSPDTDGQSLQDKNSTWNGDSLQFRFDSWGPNSSGDATAPFSTNDANMPNVSFSFVTAEGKENAQDHRNVIPDINASTKFKYGYKDNMITWEIAIKHSDICLKNADALKKIDEGFTYGFTIVRLNAPKGEKYNAWLTWGDGVCGPQDNALRSGSNGVKLSSEPAVVPEAAPEKAPTAAATSDVEYVMFAMLAVVSLAGAVLVTKKSKR